MAGRFDRVPEAAADDGSWVGPGTVTGTTASSIPELDALPTATLRAVGRPGPTTANQSQPVVEV
jgi:hypothetical protein